MAKSKINAEISLKSNGIGGVVADVHKVTDAFKKSSQVVDGLKLKLASVSQSLRKVSTASIMGFTAVAGGVGLAVKSVIGFADGVASKMDSIAKFSRNVGLSATQLQKWQYAAERSGMTGEQFNNSIRKFSSNVSKAVGGEKKQVELFNALGISLRKSNGEVKNNNDLMIELAGAYDKISNAQDKVRITEELFGRAAIGINNLFENGQGGLLELLKRRERLGGMFTEEDAKNGEAFKDLLLDVSKISEGVQNQFVGQMLPSLNQGMNDFLDVWDKHGGKILEKTKIAADVVGQSFIKLVELVGDWCNVLDQADLLFSVTGDDVKFVLKEIKNEMNKLVDWWKGVPIVGKIVDFFFTGTAKSNPVESVSKDLKSVAPKQESNPIATTTATSYTESKSTTNTSKVLIDVKGSNANYNVDVDEAFNKDKNVGINYGYTFAY